MATGTARHDIAVGVFRSEAAARQAVAQLRAQGFDQEAIHVVADEDEQQRNEPGNISDNTITHSRGGLVVGALIGAVAGLLIGVVLSSGLVPLPDLVAGIGPVGMIIGVMACGAALGMLGGSMGGLGQARQETKGLEKQLDVGRWLVSLNHPDTEAARAALQKVGADDLRVQTPTPRPVKSGAA
jgi:predicted lipid-binding transport protein (Tim44 family)